jgi:hypothetical protein
MPPLVKLNPLRAFREPLVAGLALGALGFLLAAPLLSALGGAVLVVLGARIAYDHRGAGRFAIPLVGAAWLRRQVTGAGLVYVAIWLIVGSLRHVTLG